MPSWLWDAWVAMIAMLMLYGILIAPRRMRSLLARLEKQGWRRVAPDDAALGSAVDDLRPFDLGDHGARPEATVVAAWAGPADRYAVQLRAHSVNAGGYRVWFQTLALGKRPLDVPGVVYILARDGTPPDSRTVESLGLRHVDVGHDLHFGVTFVVYDNVWGEARLPRALQEALLASADLFVPRAGRRPGHVADVVLRLSPSGWALLAPRAVSTEAATRAFLEAADRVASALV